MEKGYVRFRNRKIMQAWILLTVGSAIFYMTAYQKDYGDDEYFVRQAVKTYSFDD
jgi:hypothetical protein